jgi:hypothetical protein
MSSVIEFLERMGADAQLRHASQEEIAAALEDTQVDAALGAAIIARSTDDLYSLLDVRPMFKTIENPGREDEDEDGEGEGDGDEEKDSLTAPAVNRSAFTSPA